MKVGKLLKDVARIGGKIAPVVIQASIAAPIIIAAAKPVIDTVRKR